MMVDNIARFYPYGVSHGLGCECRICRPTFHYDVNSMYEMGNRVKISLLEKTIEELRLKVDKLMNMLDFILSERERERMAKDMQSKPLKVEGEKKKELKKNEKISEKKSEKGKMMKGKKY